MRQVIFSSVLFCGMIMYLMVHSVVRKDITLAPAAPPHAVGNAGDVSAAVSAPALPAACAVAQRYPETIRRWCPDIQESAQRYNLDVNLLAAVMLQESGGDPQAYSHSGAVGLMQVMPRDGLASQFQCEGHPCFSKRPSMAELYDPHFNIDFGAQMISGLIYRHGSLREALHYYGPLDVGYNYADLVLSIHDNYQD